MADAHTNKVLTHQAAEAILKAILEMAPDAGTAGLLELAQAYALVTGNAGIPAAPPPSPVSVSF